jgi:hypothetical protein
MAARMEEPSEQPGFLGMESARTGVVGVRISKVGWACGA